MLPKLLSSLDENQEMVFVPGGRAGHMSAAAVLTCGPKL